MNGTWPFALLAYRCGAVSGGTVALGLVLADKKVTERHTKELHAWFTGK